MANKLLTTHHSLITMRDLFKVFLRSFFIQSLWNFERMQNVGFLHTIIPALKKIYPDKEKYKESLLRHLGFFNTQPYIANFIVGVTLAKEEEHASEGGVSAQQISVLKKNLSGPLAALADTIFWAGTRPLFALLGTILSLSRGIWGAVTFLLLYNLVHIPTRLLGVIWGYRLKEGIVGKIKRFQVQGLIKTKDAVGVVISCLGIAVLFKLWPFLGSYPGYPWIRLATILICITIMGLFSLVIRRGVSPSILFFILVSLSLILAPFF